MAIGVAASVLLLPLNAKAQKTPSGLKDSNPPTELRVSKKMTPAERQEKMNEHIAKHPLLHKRLVPQMAKRDSLVRHQDKADSPSSYIKSQRRKAHDFLGECAL